MVSWCSFMGAMEIGQILDLGAEGGRWKVCDDMGRKLVTTDGLDVR
jgi:hypothetical protein